MEKHYQIFISSTFTDLVEERQAAIKAVLELDHMPAGMELFPAVDDGAWQLIKDVIDASDYYVLIVGGRYGSTDDEGVGYTEKEYDYAVSTSKPVVALLHKNPQSLPREKTEQSDAAWDKLGTFRKKVESKHTCVYWESGDDLKAKLIVGITANAKRRPAPGWIRADKVPTDATLSEILTLRSRVAELETQLEESRTGAPPGTEDLQGGDDHVEIPVGFIAQDEGETYPWESREERAVSVKPSWNELFAAVAPKLINEASDADLRRALESFFVDLAQIAVAESGDFVGKETRSFGCDDGEIDTCVVQLRALGLIEESRRKRSVRDTGSYWALTRYGDHQMVVLRALKRPSPASG